MNCGFFLLLGPIYRHQNGFSYQARLDVLINPRKTPENTVGGESSVVEKIGL